ncbi:hypothetical protein [Mesorhizobium amorphae]|uniref:hypothetical protein n=1 Tax=Mesorhizobium amorphae TaxID=71433 RepID=UPI001FEF789E|nr:hypothetical protein [Mesorhizobium amorphae]
MCQRQQHGQAAIGFLATDGHGEHPLARLGFGEILRNLALQIGKTRITSIFLHGPLPTEVSAKQTIFDFRYHAFN